MDFDKYQYRELNPDLQNLKDEELIKHFEEYNIKEDRIYKDIYFDRAYFCEQNNYDIYDDELYLKYSKDIRQSKNNIFKEYINNLDNKTNKSVILLVNHDDNLYGASNYLYNLFNILKEKYINIDIYLCEIKYNPIILSKYGIEFKNVLEYKSDPTLLYMLYDYYNPVLIYLNSINYAITKIIDYIPQNKRILHSHETYENYSLSKTHPDYVVSDKIAEKYENNQVKIQPPFLTNIENIISKSNENIQVISNKYGILNSKNITIGMCGQISNRKNYLLFIEVSKLYKNFNFIWIGDTSDVFDDYENIYHITNTENPYKYYKQIIDYFVLFSIIDPCPYVILENILLNNNIIVFEPNILYNHNHKTISRIYNIYPYEINVFNFNMAIKRFVKKKKIHSCKNIFKNKRTHKNTIIHNISNNIGELYIKKYFSYPNEVIVKINSMLK